MNHNYERMTPGGFTTTIMAAGARAKAKCRELLAKEMPTPRRLPADDGRCCLCGREGEMRQVCEECEDHAASFDAMEMDLMLTAMGILRLLPHMKKAGAPPLLRGKLHFVFEEYLKRYLPKPLTEKCENELTEKVWAGLEDAS